MSRGDNETLHTIEQEISFDDNDNDSANGEEIWPLKETLPTLQDIQRNRIEKEKYLSEYQFPFCADASKFINRIKIGQGAYG